MNCHKESRMKRKDRPFLVCITGGIASGKTAVCKYIESLEYKVYYADIIASNVRDEPKNIDILIERYGDRVLDKGTFSKEKLSKIVFTDSKELQFLNNLIHPLVRKKIQNIIDESTEEIIFFEIPLLFESKLEAAFDLTVNISADLQDRILRIIDRDGVTKENALKRISSQMSGVLKRKKADITIENNKSTKDLTAKVALLLKDIPNMPQKKIKRITDL